MLGLTFKENVPDLRNTRVVDIIAELRDYGAKVQIFDPLAEPAEAEHEYGISLTPRDRLAPAQAVVFAVPHREFVDGGWALMTSLLAGGTGVVADIKAKLPRSGVPRGIALWRL
jgi:UDP-N-acetyl-D-galactosamine dehydrogenase